MCRCTDWKLFFDVKDGKKKLERQKISPPRSPKIPPMKANRNG
ncbi:hypothetical protein MPK70_gp117 [Erwinia phage pEa_SNUABM_33]|uniref:Uncharacterized protein n=1 Tax=Erwinia phage pEa_SNUABM_33 TaxID=2869556 RepID=A0AAE7XLT6_9CAUD|nr:hypothetical protein MPK70_gp117 [Erwinia phage pEa_SNUABM_33]QZE57993.1 hypothetical protein pEaSNUABM33_00117 [Erwinia phage pEa_SNUABM_33]WAK44351.1 hypothetical protein [Erwinia phage vB_Ea_2910A]